MSRIETGKIRMKPRWYFVLGSLGMFIGLIGISTVSAFLFSLTLFSLKSHGPMGSTRLQQLLQNFPWWALGIAFVGTVLGVLMLKKFDFSYKKNFLTIVIIFIGSIIIAGFTIDYLEIDSLWARGRMMRGLYQNYGQGRSRIHNNLGN